MIRLSLGISFTSKKIKCVCLNLDDMLIVHCVSKDLANEQRFPLNHLAALDQIFHELKELDVLSRVVCIRVSAPETIGVLSSPQLFKNLMSFTAYAKSLPEHFEDSFLPNAYVGYENDNYSNWSRWSQEHDVDYDLPINALKFSLESYFSRQSSENVRSIQFLSSSMTSIIAGKKAPVDISCTWVSGLQKPNSHVEYDDNLKIENGKKTLDKIKPFHEGFSYIAPYFVEKFGFYHEALVLTAGGHQAATAIGSSGLVYLDTDELLSLGAIVKDHVDFDRECNVCGLASDSLIQMAHTEFNHFFEYDTSTLPSDICWDSLSFDTTVEDYSLMYIKERALVLDKSFKRDDRAFLQECYLISYLMDMKKSFPAIDELVICGEGKNNPAFVQMVSDLFDCTVKTLEQGEYCAAIGNALGGARRFREEDYDVILNSFFDNQKFEKFTPNPTSVSDFLNLKFRYENLT